MKIWDNSDQVHYGKNFIHIHECEELAHLHTQTRFPCLIDILH